MKNILFTLFILTVCSLLYMGTALAQAPEIEWENSIGGTSDDRLNCIKQSFDGGYIAGGISWSEVGADKTEAFMGGSWGDFWVVKLTPWGEVEWDNTIGGSGSDYLNCVEITHDSCYIVGGYSTTGVSGDKTEANIGDADYWILKLDTAGNILWQNTIGGTARDELKCIRETADGGFILGGESSSNISGDKTGGGFGINDYWIVRLNAVGDVLWDKTFGGNDDEHLTSLEITDDGGYIIGGYSSSEISGNKTEPSVGGEYPFYNLGCECIVMYEDIDYWVIKIDSIGDIEWQNTIGGNVPDYLFDLEQTQDGGYILGGYSTSDISGDKNENTCIGGYYGYDYWIVKLNAVGEIEWQNDIGAGYEDYLRNIEQTDDGGYFLTGYSSSPGGCDMEGGVWGIDYWILKLDSTGQIIEWQDIIRSGEIDYIYSGASTIDGGYILGGYSNSDAYGDKSEDNLGLFTTSDYWIVKLACHTPTLYYLDLDLDGYGDANNTISSCESYLNYVFDSTDCNDEFSFIYPGAPELCNTFDDNCNGLIDDDAEKVLLFADLDNDSYGDAAVDTLACPGTVGFVADSTDCNDLNSFIHPGGIETCNNLDENCNGLINEDLPVYHFFKDADHDDFGNPAIDSFTCMYFLIGYTTDSTDCDDTNDDIYPGAPEILNSLDDNCNLLIDEGLVGVAVYETEDIILYPNPTTEKITLLWSSQIKAESGFSIMNVNGQIVFHTTIVATQYELNVRNYPTGIYFIRLNSEASNKVYSFVKN